MVEGPSIFWKNTKQNNAEWSMLLWKQTSYYMLEDEEKLQTLT